jgi:ABC-2 type transport system ATP-binding protein
LAIMADGRIVATGTADELIGASTPSTHVRFRLADGDEPPAGLGARPAASAYELDTAEPTRTLHELTAWALSAEVELHDLEVGRRSLEDVYLQLTAEAESGTPAEAAS